MDVMDVIKLIYQSEDKIVPVAIAIPITVIASSYIFKSKKKHTQLKQAYKANVRGIPFGKQGAKIIFSPTAAEGHICVYGGSGLGKTTAILIPSLRSWTGTSFTIDISGDICINVDMPNKMIYEPANPQSTPYNVFGSIDQIKAEDDKNEALEALAFILMPEDDKMTDTAKFFCTEGRKILTAALIAFYHQGMDFIPIIEKVFGSSYITLFQEIDRIGNQKATRYINSFAGANEQNTAGCKQAADSALKLFATNERIKQTIRRPRDNEICFTPAQIETHNVFAVLDDSRLELYSPLLHLLTAQSLDYFSARPNDSQTNILFCLDEFSSLGHLDITAALRRLRKKHIRVMTLTQSLQDVDLIYGHDERMAMMDNYRYKVVLGASDTDTQEYFAKLIGYQDTKRHSVSSNNRQTTRTESEAKEWIIEPAELGRLGDDLILLHPDGYLRLRKNYYFK